MNEQSLNALTSPFPNDREKIARYIGDKCAVDYPHLRRPRETYVWCELLVGVLTQPAISKWAFSRDKAAFRRIVAMALDIWGYRIGNY